MTGPDKSRPLDCDAVQELLPLYVGADLPSAERTSVDVHLGSCLSCYRESREQTQVLEFAHAAAFHGPDMPDHDRFAQDVLDEIHGPPPTRSALWLRLSAISGWAAALVLGGILWSSQSVARDGGQIDTPSSPPVTSVEVKHQPETPKGEALTDDESGLGGGAETLFALHEY